MPLVLAGLIGALLCASSGARGGPPEFPNVLVILPDQHRADVLGVAGDPLAITPNLDRLARGGARFTRMVSEAPVCIPTRATLMTGYSSAAHHLQVAQPFDPPNTVYFAEVFRRAGYATGFSGKWHIDGSPNPFTLVFDELYETRLSGYVPPNARRGFDEWNGYDCCEDHDVPTSFDEADSPPVLVPLNDGRWEPTWQVDTFLEFAQRHNQGGRPWLYWMSMGPPHNPVEAPDEFWNLFSPTQFTPAPGVDDVLPSTLRDELKAQMAAYYAMIAFVDSEVGRAMDGLAQLGVDQNTIIVYLSDHGDLLGAHYDTLFASEVSAAAGPNEHARAELEYSSFAASLMRYKNAPYTSAFRIPFIVQWPAKIPAGLQVDALASTLDIPPTILKLAGLPVPWRMQGQSMDPWLLGGRGPESTAQLVRADSARIPWSAVWTGDLLFCPDTPFRSLYDHRLDPFERDNRIDEPSLAGVQAGLQDRLNDLNAKFAQLPALPNVCGEIAQAEAERSLLLAQLGAITSDLLLDGLPTDAYLRLIGHFACTPRPGYEEITDALLKAFARNVNVFDETDFSKYRSLREIIVLLAGMGDPVRDELSAAVAGPDPAATLSTGYFAVSCSDSATCLPDSIGTPADSPMVCGPASFPLSGSGDLDGDGLTNAEEFANVQTRRGSLDDFVRASTDPALNGSESHGDGTCFIATAAYGTPLARELDALRGLRDRALLTGPLGAALVDTYYRLSPPIAAHIAQSDPARTATRFAIGSLLFILPHEFAALSVALAAALAAYSASKRRWSSHRHIV